MRLFISYSRKDFPTVDQLRNDLRDASIEVWIDKVGLTPGTLSWEQALRDAIRDSDAVLLCASPDSRESPYVRDEVALAKQANKAIYPAWVAGENWLDCVPLGLGGTQYADLRNENYPTGLMQLIGAVRGEITPVTPLVADDTPATIETVAPDFTPRNPYKGLQAFKAADVGDFFGRDALITELLAAVHDKKRAARLIALLGASGSGKSSVMMAGVLPRLQAAHPDWTFLTPIVPSANPLEKLSIMLARQFGNKAQLDIRKELEDNSTRGLHRLACEISDKPVVLYIDQFEEIFTLVEQEADRRHFIDLLTTAMTEPDGVLIVLMSMRADFYDRPLQFTPFGKLIETHHIAITPMTLADLYDVVQKPAQLPDVRLSFDDGLVTEMVFAVREETAALPLLQFTLDQLFEKRADDRLTTQAYQEIGGIQGALAQHADSTYRNLPSDQHRSLARALFLRLIEPGQTEQDTTRRRATYNELTLPDAEQTRILQETAAAFVNARLLVSDQSGDTRTVEVSHEALIREWGRLREWLHAAREDLRLQKSLVADVAEWQRRGQPADMLYRGTVLAEAQTWAERNRASRDETAFLEKSHRTENERQRREAVTRRNFRYALLGLVGVIVFASVGLAVIFAQNNAKLQAEVAFTNLEINRFSTLRAGDVIVPLGTQTPGFFEPTMTAVAILNAHNPSLAENQMTDEYGVDMVRVPAGCFFMGSDRGSSDEQPTHEICFDAPFWIDKTEVTQADFARLGGVQAAPPGFTGDDLPVETITWTEALDFCETREGRLPTEAEWEYAARGPDNLVYPWGSEFIADNVVYRENSNSQTAPVGSRPDGASWVGALDMSGNVWEWTLSEDRDYPYDSDDGRENISSDARRVVRGGAWYVDDFSLRAANRISYDPTITDVFLGFRCVRPPSP